MGTDRTSTSIPQPIDWQAFERNARILFAHVLEDPLTKTSGRAGQRQHGVDIYGRRKGTGAHVGIQCKGKSAAYGNGVSHAELRREVAAARLFKPKLDEFILITTAPDDVSIEQEARRISEELEKGGERLRVAVWGWNTLTQHIAMYHEAYKAFHPDATPISDELLGVVKDTKNDTSVIRAMVEHGSTIDDRSRQRPHRFVMMAPEPPLDMVARPREFGTLKEKLLKARGSTIAISAALKGAGGYGKTTLAKALAHDADIQREYFDGVLWIELGESPENLLSIIADLVEILTGDRPGIENVNTGASHLANAIGMQRILMVIDDVWREKDLSPFLQGGPMTARLVTTRLNRVLPLYIFRQPVDAMTVDEACKLLSSGLPAEQARPLHPRLIQLASRLGEWPQLLKLVNGFLVERVMNAGEPLSDALLDANERLTEEGLGSFDANDEDGRTKAISRTINVSLALLDQAQRRKFSELALFPEDADIPIEIIARLWEKDGLSSERDSQKTS